MTGPIDGRDETTAAPDAPSSDPPPTDPADAVAFVDVAPTPAAGDPAAPSVLSGRARGALLAIVAASGLLIAVLVGALVLVLRDDPPAATPEGTGMVLPDASTATLVLDPPDPIAPGTVTARVTVVSPFGFEAVAIDVDGVRVASSADARTLLAFPVETLGPHRAVATVSLSNGAQVTSPTVSFTTRAGRST